jgi:hypothetical protein
MPILECGIISGLYGLKVQTFPENLENSGLESVTPLERLGKM